MSENCTHNCNTCGADCASRKSSPSDFLEKPHELSHIKKVIGVVSGKGGVGKSMVTSLLAVVMRRREFNTAILDAVSLRLLELKKKQWATEWVVFFL